MCRLVSGHGDVDVTEHTRPVRIALTDAYIYLAISAGADVRRLASDLNDVLYEYQSIARVGDMDAHVEAHKGVRAARARLRSAIRMELGILD
jgi:hypothetical protein